jgi:hypothetical protein
MENASQREPLLIAADTNILLDFAKEDETVIDCFDTLRGRLPISPILVLPTVIHELADLADEGETVGIRLMAETALRRILHPWGFQPVNCVPVGHGIVEQIAWKLRAEKLIPETEINDSFIVAEAGLIGISILLSSDAHLKDIPQPELRLVLDSADVRAPLIASPWKIVSPYSRPGFRRRVPAGRNLPAATEIGHRTVSQAVGAGSVQSPVGPGQDLPAVRQVTEEVVQNIRSWQHSGFSVDQSVRVEAQDREGLQRLIEYFLRCPFSQVRIIEVTGEGKVLYKTEHNRLGRFPEAASEDLLAGPKRNFQVFDPLDFLAEVTQHIPQAGEHLIRYYGFYSNKSRGLGAQVQPGVATNAEPAPTPKEVRQRWAALIKQVYEVDPLLCPKCGGQMKIIGFIERHQSEVIEKILRHCGLWEEQSARAPPEEVAAR